MNILKEVKMVPWGFIGPGDRNRAQPPTGNPLVLLAVALVVVVLLLGTLIVIMVPSC